jgi:hypothetical protein
MSLYDGAGNSPFRPLPSPRSTRILKLKVINEQLNKLYGELIVDDLADVVRDYIAPLYTWGPAVTYDAHSIEPKHRSRTCLDLEVREAVDEANASSETTTSSIRLTQNLSDFFRHHHQKIIDEGNLLWIDALCINQQDPAEVAFKIFQMDASFGSARAVWVWLCPEFYQTFLVDLSMSQIYPAIHRLWEVFKEEGESKEDVHSWMAHVSPIHGHFWYYQMGIVIPSHSRWEEIWARFITFFHTRTWFSRVWLIQEAVLARSLLLVIGDHFVNWEPMQSLEVLLMETGWLPILEGLVDTSFERYGYDFRHGAFRGILGVYTYHSNRISTIEAQKVTEPLNFQAYSQHWTTTFTLLLDAVSAYSTSTAADYLNSIIGLAKRMLPASLHRLLAKAPSHSTDAVCIWSCSMLAGQGLSTSCHS